MVVRKLLMVPLLAVILMTGGCYTQPVRHLAADVALLQEGKSTTEDVLIFLGEPDEQRQGENGSETWIYKEEKRSFFEKTPYVGQYIGSPDYRVVVVEFKNGVVVRSEYKSSDEDDLDWARDFSWQDK